MDIKYKHHREVEYENFLNTLDCMDIDYSDIPETKLKELSDELYDVLANDELYNEIYNNTACRIYSDYARDKTKEPQKAINVSFGDVPTVSGDTNSFENYVPSDNILKAV